jgi:hypothetical protein
MDPVPEEITSRYPNVTLSIDIIFVSVLCRFFQGIEDWTVPVASRHDTELSQVLKRLIAR